MPARFRASHGNLTIATLLLFLGSGPLAAQSRVEIVSDEPAPTRPEKISGAHPVYTEMARRAGVEGVVIVESVIDEEGNVTNARVLRGLPMGLNEAALEALQTWKFKPSTQEGRPVKVYYTLTVNFKIQRDSRFGPAFSKLLEKHPELAEPLNERRYEHALALLDRWTSERPADFEIQFARSHVLLEQGRIDEAFEEARAYRGPDSYEILSRIGAYAWSRVYYDKVLSSAARAELVELGLEAEARAMAVNREDEAALFFKGLLLEEQAKLTHDLQERQNLFDEAKEILRRTLEPRNTGRAPETPLRPASPPR